MYSKDTEQQAKPSKTPQQTVPNEEYHAVVCVKETGEKNGPGHATAMLIKSKNGQTQIHTTSFFPGMFGSIINGLTFGSIPVPGQLAPDHVQDVAEADHILTTPISKQQFKEGKQGCKKLDQDVRSGHQVYSVFGKANPVANGMRFLTKGAAGAHLAVEKHKKETGSYPGEDMCGIHVYDDDHPTVPKMKIGNCTSSVTGILNKTGIKIEDPKIPSFFTPVLKEKGFTQVDKDDFMKKYCGDFKL
ncbi:Uncharacterised protein [Legionella steigerwaltii]|uniref:Uncharacterized protein n=1 Tax=Legionella steigerwaltii TaxID=460 RepID=A0A378LBF6_9GAMM|nr:hypothetical protein [Legionella steigerwaltii]KTD77749.1 hypothetical protein Lstg_2106 [Legionella steigerwaltii]STY23059.1 Uncharacterised protein [Legionella steigerwaltii]